MEVRTAQIAKLRSSKLVDSNLAHQLHEQEKEVIPINDHLMSNAKQVNNGRAKESLFMTNNRSKTDTSFKVNSLAMESSAIIFSNQIPVSLGKQEPKYRLE